MIKIEIKNKITGQLIFEYSKPENSISETIKEYIKQELEKGFRSADLSYANLRSADLRSADLSSANLSSADLSYANLRSADLRYADLSSANLSSANLSSADLSYANLRSADLRSADLSYANLRSADLSYAKLDKRYIQVSCIGSAKRITTYCFDDDIVWCGCFRGTLSEFEAICKIKHQKNDIYLKEYLGFVNYVRSLN